jgi:murein endopeptidase
VLRAERAWGQPLVVWRLNEVLCAYHEQFPSAAQVLIQDLSKRHGGKLKPHHSHRRGWDVDIGVVRRGRAFDRFVPASPRTLDVEKTWWLIHALISTGDVEYVFLNRRLIRPIYRYARKQGISRERMRELFHYPRRSRWGLGIIRAEAGHLAHFHVRFLRKRPSVPQPVM